MTKVRRPILIAMNLLLLLLGGALLAGSIAIRQSSNVVLRHHPPKEEVEAKVRQMTDTKKLQAMAINQYEYMDNLASIIEGLRDSLLVSAIVVVAFGLFNFALIPWRLAKSESHAPVP